MVKVVSFVSQCSWWVVEKIPGFFLEDVAGVCKLCMSEPKQDRGHRPVGL